MAVVGGANSPTVQLTQVRQIVALEREAMLLVDRSILAVQVFSRDGAPLGRIGRPGQGPGELQSVARIGVSGDTVWIVDERAWRRKFFLVDGTFLTEEALPLDSVWHQGLLSRGAATSGFLGGGARARVRPLNPEAQDATVPRSGVLEIVQGQPARPDSLAVITIAPDYFRLHVNRLYHQVRPRPFNDTELWTTTADGERVILVQRPMAGSGAMAFYRVSSFAGDGRTLFATDVPYKPEPVSDALLDSIVAYYAGEIAAADPELPRAAEIVRDSLAGPEFMPPVTAMFVASDGMVWLAREGLARRMGVVARNYDIIAPSGRLTARLRLVSPSRILTASSQSVWIVEHDDDDVPVVLRYAIKRDF